MTETTLETYSVDGEVLNTYAWNLRTLTGRSGMPAVVGENRTVTFRPGRVWQRKDFDQRSETWAMWVLGCDADGSVPTTGSRAEFNKNLDDLKRIFGVRHRELELQKVQAFPDGLRTLTGKGECVGTWEPTVEAGGTRATFSAEIVMADPFWYGEVVNATVGAAGETVNNPGSTIAQKMTLVFNGPLSTPRLRNATTGVEVRLLNSLGSGQSITLDTDLFTALNEGAVNSIAQVSQLGSDWWMELVPGENELELENWQGGGVGSGSVTVAFLPPYL